MAALLARCMHTEHFTAALASMPWPSPIDVKCLTATCKLGLPTPPQPQVHTHFTTALETVTAAGQLGTAIQTLSLCVRPLLVAGLPVQAANGSAAGAASTAGDALEAAAAAAAAVSVQPASEEQRAAAAQAIASGERLRQ